MVLDARTCHNNRHRVPVMTVVITREQRVAASTNVMGNVLTLSHKEKPQCRIHDGHSSRRRWCRATVVDIENCHRIAVRLDVGPLTATSPALASESDQGDAGAAGRTR